MSVSSGCGSPQSSQACETEGHGPIPCIIFAWKRASDFSGLTDFLLPKTKKNEQKRKNYIKLDQLGHEREGSALRHQPMFS